MIEHKQKDEIKKRVETNHDGDTRTADISELQDTRFEEGYETALNDVKKIMAKEFKLIDETAEAYSFRVLKQIKELGAK